MTSPLPTVVPRDISPFAIDQSTRVTVRFDDLRLGLCQECKIVRRQGASVYASLLEYSGTRFRLRVDLNRRTVSLFSPDYSWFPKPEDIVAGVVQRIVQMLETKRSTTRRVVTRYRENICKAV